MNKAIYAPYGVQMARELARGGDLGAQGAGGFVSRLTRLPLMLIQILYVWQQRLDGRNRLHAMDNRLLADMGLNRADADREAALPFWRAS